LAATAGFASASTRLAPNGRSSGGGLALAVLAVLLYFLTAYHGLGTGLAPARKVESNV